MRKAIVTIGVAVGLFITIVLFRLPKAPSPSVTPSSPPTPSSDSTLPFEVGEVEDEFDHDDYMAKYYEGE